MSKDNMTIKNAKQALKEKFKISDRIMSALIYARYDFEKNRNKNFSYTQILEWIVNQISKELVDETIDSLATKWTLEIPVDLTKIYNADTGKLVRNRTLRKFIESLGLYEWITIDLYDKKMEVEDDAICWGFGNNKGGPIMTVQKKKNGEYEFIHDG